MHFPVRRLRRLRRTEAIRKVFEETRVLPEDLMYPIFVWEEKTESLKTLPGQFRWNLNDPRLFEFLRELENRGLRSIMVFGVATKKDKDGTQGWDESGPVQEFVRKVKRVLPGIAVATDVCLCTWREDGHCGVVRNGEILNDETLEYLGKIALSHARAGADIVAPSDMMDGRVKYIRDTLDSAGFQNTLIMSYSAKYASSFYGPFRDAAHSAPAFGDRATYQMNPTQSREAILEVRLDFEEGADILMVKPALPYLDVIKAVRENFPLPVAAFNVSGEYAMVKLGTQAEIFDAEKVVREVLTSIKRAGADIIISYFVPDFLGVKPPV